MAYLSFFDKLVMDRIYMENDLIWIGKTLVVWFHKECIVNILNVNISNSSYIKYYIYMLTT